MQLASGAWVTQMIHVAAELGVADQLTAGGRPVEELAEACGAEADGLFRLLRGPGQPGHLRGNRAAPVRAHAAGGPAAQRPSHSMRMVGRLMGDEHYLGWTDLLHSVRTGEGAFRHRYGMSVFEWYQQNPRRGAIFDGAMGDHSRAQIDALLAAYDFSGISHLVDVGGGAGGGAAGAGGKAEHSGR
jgi:hypothetical protein